ncbi:refilin-A isoform X1 [Lagenorhynchus albirostris]|uniref:refilin-A isoform X1 n=2 Tax=Lagenorhynchus albirostris TaxID=27610 RepID=UPI0028E61E9E|nr:refilin-A isoform X1 [Lagenorhynchus albirostris]
MVGHLHLQGMEESLKEKSREGLLDSPDSGLPPSPSPSPPFYSLAPGILDARAGGSGASSEAPGPGEAKAPLPLPPSTPAREMRPRMLPVFFGESIEVNPEPTPEIRCNSEVKYASERHFRDKVFYAPVPTVTAYSETIVAAPNCTWRSYRSQLTLEPRPRALRFRSTTIIFPKRARSSFRTTLHLSLGRPRRWFTASVQLQLCPRPGPGLLGPAPL